MTVSIRQLQAHFFGEVSGVDLRKPLTPQEARNIEAGMDKYAVLLFPGQDITDQQQMAFALNFGQRENPRGGNVVKPEDSRLPPPPPTTASHSRTGGDTRSARRRPPL